jgi:hypothetical protein
MEPLYSSPIFAQRHILIWGNARLTRVGDPESPTGLRLVRVVEMSQRGIVLLHSSMLALESKLRGPGWEGPLPCWSTSRTSAGPDGKVSIRPGLHSIPVLAWYASDHAGAAGT